MPTARLRFSHRKLANLHPAEIADLVEAASHEEGEEIIKAVGQDRELEADVFEELDEHHQLEFIRERPDEQVAAVIARMAADDAADLIVEIDQERRARILALLPLAQRRQIEIPARLQPRDRRRPDEPRLHRARRGGRLGGRRRSSGCARARSRRLRSPPSICTTTQGKLSGSVAVVTLLRSDRARAAGGRRRARAGVGAHRRRPAGGRAHDDRLQPRDAACGRRGAARRRRSHGR